jgi:RHS repeat-associated protein
VTPFGYAGASGAQTDATSGLVLMGNRFYDAATGRFLSRDPAGAGENWYAYCSNNPVSNIDPLGLQSSDGGGGGGGSNAFITIGVKIGAFIGVLAKKFGLLHHGGSKPAPHASATGHSSIGELGSLQIAQ